jgi:ligand-binding SRPBCC domain-containing protein
MTTLTFKTAIHATAETVFNLARDVDFHTLSAQDTGEKAVAGKTSGLLGLGDAVTWRGRHFGLWLTHRSRISAMAYPFSFVDEMEAGHFRSFRHFHRFGQANGQTVMTDVVHYELPMGLIGRIFDRFVLRWHLAGFIGRRNAMLKAAAERKSA